jgi:very-short-patch-repair endonuclease
MGMGERDRILEEVERCRRRLLDLSLRNRLLNLRPPKVRGVDVVDESSAEVFRILVREQHAMTFVGRKSKHLVKPSAKPGEQDLEPIPVDPSDNRLNTAILEEHLQDRLLRIFNDARTLLEEQGVNTLFLVLGRLEWYEAEASQTARKAPLILVPVSLERKAAERFKLTYSGEDFGTNLSLAAKLDAEFGITFPELPDSDELNVDAYFNAVERQISTQKRWRVDRNAIHLGFFSYAKFLMYKDLDPERWEGGDGFLKHDNTKALLIGSFREDSCGLGESDFLDPHRPPSTAHEVVDADSSQVLALLDTGAGKNLVIEGPPGTGKSQTITNVIAEAIAAGKKVLFVAEKMAALEVVKRFLDRVEIGDACLELHSQKARRRDVLDDLARTLHLRRPSNHHNKLALAQLDELRLRLNEYVTALHTSIGDTGVTPYDAYGELIRLESAARALPRVNADEVSGLNREQYATRRARVAELQDWLSRYGPLRQHPFFGCNPQGVLRTDIQEFLRDLKHASEVTDAFLEATGTLVEQLCLSLPDRPSEVETACVAARFVSTAPHEIAKVNASDPGWVENRQALAKIIKAGRRVCELNAKYDAVLKTRAWKADVEDIRQVLADCDNQWFRQIKPSFRRAREAVAELCRNGLPDREADWLVLVEAIREAQHCSAILAKGDTLAANLLGKMWKGVDSHWDKCECVGTWIWDLHSRVAVGEFPVSLLGFLAKSRDIKQVVALLATTESCASSWRGGWQPLLNRLQPNGNLQALVADDCSIRGQRGVLAKWAAAPERILEIPTYNRLRKGCSEVGLESLCQLAETSEPECASLVDALDTTRYEALLRKARAERPALEVFDGTSHQTAIDNFRRVDEEVLRLNRARVAHAHHERIPHPTGSGTMGTLLGEMNRKKGHMPLRKLMAQCWGPIQDIKPVFMMSPLSVAMYLPPNGPRFDLVIFDEASQVRPEDSLGAILRGRQLVVVGDSKQMPPTSFFMRLVESEEESENEEEQVRPAGAGEMESVLSLMRARAAPARWLRWHYRSRHHSLIAVSNHNFYDGKLLVFPSISGPTEAEGLSFQHLPHSVYGRGHSHANPDEAKAVVEAIVAHAKATPELTLGVVAFSRAQEDALQIELERARKSCPEVLAFEERHKREKLFTKNLENVQGDERDVIFISVGYGRDSAGVLSHNFGPINADGGERRLNVLMTRARIGMRVFCNFLPGDVDLAKTNARGVRVLKHFLQYAQTGELDLPAASGREAGSEFEEAVQQALQAHGYDVERQVGSMGFFIDLAVRDPEHPGQYLIGIECDGATYHSARSARDRDRLREQVLRSRRWILHRIWSTDWFTDQEAQLRRAVEAIEAAKSDRAAEAAGRAAAAPKEDGSASVFREAPQDRVAENGALGEPYAFADLSVRLGGVQLHEVEIGRLATWVLTVVEAESPVHVEEVLRRIREAAGVYKAGTRIRGAIDRAIQLLRNERRIRKDGEFLVFPAMKKVPIRSREGFPPAYKGLDRVSPDEICAAIQGVVARSYGISMRELPGATCRALGFNRVTEEMEEATVDWIRTLLAKGRLRKTGEVISTVAD